MTITLRVAHLYPRLMNIYGDRGNIMCLRRRCVARSAVDPRGGAPRTRSNRSLCSGPEGRERYLPPPIPTPRPTNRWTPLKSKSNGWPALFW